MAYLTLPGLSRRAFSLSVASGAATLLRSAEAEMHWALLSDTHIAEDPADQSRGFKPHENLKQAVSQLLAAKPQGALVCGDLARNKGLAGDYANLKSILAPVSSAMPLALALGNHDDRKNFLASFGTAQQGAQSVRDKHTLVVEGPLARFIVLDSNQRADIVPGLLGKTQRAWLAEFLQTSSDLPTVIFVHHTLSDGDDALLDAPRFFDIVKDQRKVKAIVYGHSHRYGFDLWQGIHLVNLPSVGYNFNDAEPVGWVEVKLSKTGGAFTLRSLGGNQEKNGKTVVLPWRS
ncbi:MAG: metallophosphoesterase [Acidobacteria bacterium]|nr:metallophosphoesterase [Acidobacteriota bacterium]